MAAWQVVFHVVPRGSVPPPPKRLAPAELDATDWWAGAAFPADYARRLAAMAPLVRSSSADLQTWGAADGNRIDVVSVGGRVSRVMVRVDVRRLDSKFGAALIDLMRVADAALVRNDGLVLERTIAAYSGALRGSNAWKYASDPIAFLAAEQLRDDDDS